MVRSDLTIMGHGRLVRMHDHPPDRYGAAFADVYDEWYGDVSDTAATVAGLRGLATGRVLELGVGTGRIGVPLADAGSLVLGLDASREMLAVLATKRSEDMPIAILADMSRLPFADSTMQLVFAAFNTMFNLTTELAQRRCIAEAARVLGPSGRLAIECFVPPPDAMPARGASVRHASTESVTVMTSKHDPADQTILGEHVEVTPDRVTRRPWALRYASPDQLDSMAAAAGLSLESRTASWSGRAFDESSDAHVSVYRPTRPNDA